MSYVLVRKLLRDSRRGLIVACLLLGLFFFLWCKVAQQNVTLMMRIEVANLAVLKAIFFETEPGKMTKMILGGEDLDPTRALDNLSAAFLHPLVQIILCIWAIGRASGAVAGELDRGTMELLLAQPIRRYQLIVSHLVLDVLTIPLLCLCLWAGIWLGCWTFEIYGLEAPYVNPLPIGPALLNVGALTFAIGGYTIWLSSMGRFRMRVLGIAVLLTLLQFMINLLGQMWKFIENLRLFTVFFYYQPQTIVLGSTPPRHLLLGAITNDQLLWFNVSVLMGVGIVGYVLALFTFCWRDLPAPL